jgi:hypothetical protein
MQTWDAIRARRNVRTYDADRTTPHRRRARPDPDLQQLTTMIDPRNIVSLTGGRR